MGGLAGGQPVVFGRYLDVYLCDWARVAFPSPLHVVERVVVRYKRGYSAKTVRCSSTGRTKGEPGISMICGGDQS